jgi:DNA mismatch endonuclease (patch repair protein)
MADVFSTRKRSQVMSRIRSRGNRATELRMIEVLKAWRLPGWRRHYRLFGSPDFVWPREHVALFVDGCFWHGCPAHGRVPSTNRHYWHKKLAGNARRDKEVTSSLKRAGWAVVRVWQCGLANNNAHRSALRIAKVLARQATKIASSNALR